MVAKLQSESTLPNLDLPSVSSLALASESPAPEVQAKDHHPTTKECLHSEDSDGTTYADTIACKFERICLIDNSKRSISIYYHI
jgi:hypothetical protein